MSTVNAEDGFTASVYTAADEVRHTPVSGESNYSESVYFNWACPPFDSGVQGGVVRIALRPTDGYRDATLIVALADGTTLFRYQRLEFEESEFDVGSNVFAGPGLTCTAVEPTRRWTIDFDGPARLLPDLAKFGDAPGVEWRAAPEVEAKISLVFTATEPVHTLADGGNLQPLREADPAARDHYEQFGHLNGTVAFGDQVLEVKDADSMRDHSWGRRDWDAIANTDQIMGYFADGTKFVALHAHRDPANDETHGCVWWAGNPQYERTPSFDAITEYMGESWVQDELPLRMTLGERTVEMTARTISMFPTRVGDVSRDGLALVALDGDLGPGAAWIDMFRTRIDS